MSALTWTERRALLEVHKAVFGPSLSHSLNGYVAFYNERTVEATEKALDELRRCNAHIQHFLAGLAGVAVLPTKGWLRDVLQKVAEELSSNNHELAFSGCRNQVAAHWVREIMMSAL